MKVEEGEAACVDSSSAKYVCEGAEKYSTVSVGGMGVERSSF